MHCDACCKAARTQEYKSSKPAKDGSVGELKKRAANALNQGNMRMGDTELIKMVEMSKTKVQGCDEDELGDCWVNDSVLW